MKNSIAKVIQEEAETLNIIKHPSQFKSIHHADEPIHDLFMYFDELQCKQKACSYIGRGVKTMKKHFRKEYPEVWDKRGKDSRHLQGTTADASWTENITCQRLFV